MQKVSKEATTPRLAPRPQDIALRPTRSLTKILLVPFRNGEAVDRHPELTSFLDDGWTISSAVPRIVETEGTRLLVVMAKPEKKARLKRIK